MISKIVIVFSAFLIMQATIIAQTTNQHHHARKPREVMQFKNVDLGIEFDYDRESFDTAIDDLPSPGKWGLYKNATLGIEFRVPPGYFVKIGKPDESYDWATSACDSCAINDSCITIFFKGAENEIPIRSVTIYWTKADFRHIAWDEWFLPITNRNIPVDIKEEDTLLVQSALSTNKWESLGRQDMREPASYLDGKVWKGLRGHNFTGVYDQNGYAGLDWMQFGFLTRKITASCFVVFSYKNTPSSRTPLEEYRFYEIVSSVLFLK